MIEEKPAPEQPPYEDETSEPLPADDADVDFPTEINDEED